MEGTSGPAGVKKTTPGQEQDITAVSMKLNEQDPCSQGSEKAADADGEEESPRSNKLGMDQATTTPSAGIAPGFDRDEGQNLLPGDEGRPSTIYPVNGNDPSDESMDALAMLVQQYCCDHEVEVDFDPNVKVIQPNSGERLVSLSRLDLVYCPVLEFLHPDLLGGLLTL